MNILWQPRATADHVRPRCEQALGIAIESRRLDRIKECILRSDDVPFMLDYCFNLCLKVIKSREYRQKIILILVQLYRGLKVPDYINVCQCLLFLNDKDGVAQILDSLLKGSVEQALMAYQVGARETHTLLPP